MVSPVSANGPRPSAAGLRRFPRPAADSTSAPPYRSNRSGVTMALRVLLVDDQPMMRAGLAMLLSAEPDIDDVHQAGDGRQAVELASSLGPDVVVMDVRMPVLDGVE